MENALRFGRQAGTEKQMEFGGGTRYDEQKNNQLSYETSEVESLAGYPAPRQRRADEYRPSIYLTRVDYAIRLLPLQDTFADRKAMTLSGLKEPPSYAELKAGYDAKGMKFPTRRWKNFRAEKMSLKSDQQIIRRSATVPTPAVEPYNVSKIRR